MGMELIKEFAVCAIISATLLLTGCFGDVANNSQQQGQTVVSNSESSPIPADNSSDSTAISTPENNKDSAEAEVSPVNTKDAESGKGEGTSADGQSAVEKNDNGKTVSQGSTAESGSNGASSSDKKEDDKNRDKESTFFDEKIMWALIGAAVMMVFALAWRYFSSQRRKKQSAVSPENREKVNYHKNSMSCKFIVGNFHNIGQRDEQQDSFCLSDVNDDISVQRKGVMAVVADGMGGLEGGAAISQIVADTFLKKYNALTNIDHPKDFLYETAKSAEEAAEKYMEQHSVEGGSTLVAVLIQGDKMHFLSVGDSHIYHFKKGTLTLINKEHNWGAVLKEKAERGEVAPDEPYVNPRRNSLTAYMGMGSFQIMDTNDIPITIRIGEKVVLCSDGVFNTLNDIEITRALAGDAILAAKQIETAVLTKGNPQQDNFTGIIVECVDN